MSTQEKVDRLRQAVEEFTDSPLLFDMILALAMQPDLSVLCTGRVLKAPSDRDSRFSVDMQFTLQGKIGTIPEVALQPMCRSMLQQAHDKIGSEMVGEFNA